MFWLGLIIGVSLGGVLGVAFMAIFQISKTTVDAQISTKNDRT